MNIFVLDKKPSNIPKHYCDIHLRKMIVEYTQLLCTSIRLLLGTKTTITSSNTGKKYTIWLLPNETATFEYIKGKEQLILSSGLYRQTHINHPCTKWTKKSFDNYTWLWILLFYCHKEYELRFPRIHKSKRLLTPLNNYIWECEFPNKYLTPWPQVMPDGFQGYSHYCYSEWDGMEIGPENNEYEICTCYDKDFAPCVWAYRRYYASKLKEFRKRGICKFTR